MVPDISTAFPPSSSSSAPAGPQTHQSNGQVTGSASGDRVLVVGSMLAAQGGLYQQAVHDAGQGGQRQVEMHMVDRLTDGGERSNETICPLRFHGLLTTLCTLSWHYQQHRSAHQLIRTQCSCCPPLTRRTARSSRLSIQASALLDQSRCSSSVRRTMRASSVREESLSSLDSLLLRARREVDLSHRNPPRTSMAAHLCLQLPRHPFHQVAMLPMARHLPALSPFVAS